jgi:hypothetical protein
MYTPIKKALAKLRADIDAVFVTRFDTWHDGVPGLRFAKAESLPPVATCFIIKAVSLLDEALILFLDNTFDPLAIKITLRPRNLHEDLFHVPD